MTLAEKLACVERALRIRKQTYPGYVLRRRMTKKQANREIVLMAEIVEDYRELLDEENSRKTLKFVLETGPFHNDETQHLLSNPVNAESLLRSIAELNAGHGVEFDPRKKDDKK